MISINNLVKLVAEIAKEIKIKNAKTRGVRGRNSQ